MPADEVHAIEVADVASADAAGHDGHMVHDRVIGHRRHGRVDAAGLELRGHVPLPDFHQRVLRCGQKWFRHGTSSPRTAASFMQSKCDDVWPGSDAEATLEK